MKKIFTTFSILLFVFSFPALAHSFFNPDTIYFKSFAEENKSASKKRANFYKVIHHFENDINDTRYYENGTNLFLYNRMYKNGIPYGKWFQADTLIKDYEYKYEIIDTAFENRNPTPVDTSKIGRPVKDVHMEVFVKMIVKRLNKLMDYPIIARENNIQERVIVRFYINKEGYLYELKAHPCVNKYFTDEVVAIFAPLINQKVYFGEIKDTDIKFNLPVNFKLNDY